MIKIKIQIEDLSADSLEILLDKEKTLDLQEENKEMLVKSAQEFLARLKEFC